MDRLLAIFGQQAHHQFTEELQEGILVPGEPLSKPPGVDCLDTEGPAEDWPPPLLLVPGDTVVGHGGVPEVHTPHPPIVPFDKVGAGQVQLPAFIPGVPADGTNRVHTMQVGGKVDSLVVLPANLAITHSKV